LVHMPSEPSGSQRSLTVSSGTSFSQATDAIQGKQAPGRTLIRMRSPIHGTGLAGGTDPRPPRPASRVLAPARIASRRPPVALDPGGSPAWSFASSRAGVVDRAIFVPSGKGARGSLRSRTVIRVTLTCAASLLVRDGTIGKDGVTPGGREPATASPLSRAASMMPLPSSRAVHPVP